MNTNIYIIIIVVLVLVILGLILGSAFSKRNRSKKYAAKYGSDYDHTVKSMGSETKAKKKWMHARSMWNLWISVPFPCRA